MTKTRLFASAEQYRAYVRRAAGTSGSVRIVVVDGGTAPVTLGESHYYTTPGGKPVYHPNAYRKAWGKPVYHASTFRVEVGRGWLTQNAVPEWAMTITRKSSERQLVLAGLFGAAAEGACRLGMEIEDVRKMYDDQQGEGR